MNEEMVRNLISEVILECLYKKPMDAPIGEIEIPVGVSGRHVHLSKADVEALFGKGYTLTKKRDISQPGQFLCEERVTLVGPKNVFLNVAVLGPVRKQTQVEISMSDARALGVSPPVAMSGELANAADITIASEKECIRAKKSLIVAKSHVHMSAEEAKQAGVRNGDLVDIMMQTERPLIFRNMPVRAGDAHKLEVHIDFDEANACLCKNGDGAILLKRTGFTVSSKKESIEDMEENVRAETNFITEKDMKIEVGFITEQHVRSAVQKGCGILAVPKKAILSALAKDYARQHKIRIDFI